MIPPLFFSSLIIKLKFRVICGRTNKIRSHGRFDRIGYLNDVVIMNHTMEVSILNSRSLIYA